MRPTKLNSIDGLSTRLCLAAAAPEKRNALRRHFHRDRLVTTMRTHLGDYYPARLRRLGDAAVAAIGATIDS